ncbi:CBM96 family carbohydrate-binding protein [Paenibacillus albidus]|nr:hypothetical protein [Paenibacillus albidus]
MFKLKRVKVASRIFKVFLVGVLLQSFVVTWNGAAPISAAESVGDPANDPTVVQWSPIEDTYVNAGGNAGNNYGSSNLLLVKNYDIDSNLNRASVFEI